MAKQLTRNDVALAAGVAPSTVSRALTGSPLLPAATIEHIRKIANEIGYQPNRLASQLASNKSYTIGFVVPEMEGKRGPFQIAYYANLLDAAVREAEKFNYTISIHSIPYTISSVAKIKKLFDSRSIDGIIVNGLTLNNRMLAPLLKSKIPFVTIGYHRQKSEFPMINCRPYLALQAMIKILEEKGYQEIIFVGGNMQFYDGVVQKEDLIEVLGNSPIRLSQEYSGDFSRKSGYQAATEIFKNVISKKTVVFLANDLMATGFYRYAYEHQISIPQKIGVIGSDDEVISRTLFPELATIRQPRAEMGETSVKELLTLMKGEKKTKTEDSVCSFINRGSI